MRIALFQCASQPLDVRGNLDRLRTQAHEAELDGVQLLVCPEMFLTGYNIGTDAVTQLAEAVDGPSAMEVVEIAQKCKLAIVYGYPERSEDGQIYNAVQLIDAQGKSRCNYRKTHLFGRLDHSMFVPGPGHFPVVELNGWQVGMLICYDLEFPENARRLALAGAELIVVPTANMVPYDFIAQVTVRARAYENQCYVAYANYCSNEDFIHYCGQSSIVAPDGSVHALAELDEERIATTLDRQLMVDTRADNYYLQNRRPELYGDLSKV
ncbi:carbon-nitrogen hydrolase family protein [Pseudomonas sp. LS1212]|uniref:carbon-nitrogen hydrolase family protein n=1 Tax=Pseudomonas sp. LS1212 TaxID=2972478 RepID=UPI00215BDD81|nr:carbon-nitrogen hydrolase family protein [Pseudomonas sp. LS1212]UVJ43660.1 carbon-nitrogen hydrolase family protein [Pseudomonas sp. LS1212]